MKKFFLKSLALMMMLTMSVSMWGATNYCHTELKSGSNVITLSCIKLDDTHYRYLIESDADLIGLGGSYCNKNGVGGYYMNGDHCVVAPDKKSLTVDIESSSIPNMYTPLYVLMPGEVNFGSLDVPTFECSASAAGFSVKANTTVGGTASVSSTFVESGEEVTFTAVSECGYTFSSWTNNGVVVVGAGATYTTTITENTTLQANFVGSGITEVVAAPTHDASNVTSIYGYYGNVTDLLMNPNWGQSTSHSTQSIAGTEVTRYSNINYQGIHFANKNVSDMQYVHFDIYAFADGDLDIFLITGGESYQRKHLTGCEWNSIDILLSDYVAQGRDLTNVYEFKFDAQNTSFKGKSMLIQNIYFYKLPAEPVSGVTLDKEEATVKMGKTLQLIATVAPVAAGNKNVTWTSDNESVATVSATGLVSALAEGEATITVTTEDGEKTATCVITVPGVNPDEVTLTSGSHTIVYTAYLIADNQYQLTISSDENLGQHGGSYWNINGVGGTPLMKNENFSKPDPTTIVITVTSTQEPQLYTPLYINMPGEVNFGQPTFVWVDKRPVVDVTEVTLEEETAMVEVEGTVNLHATVAPENATSKNVTWESSNTAIATVDENGVVTGVAAGEVTITVKSVADNTKSASCVVTVSAEPVVKEWIALTSGTHSIEYRAYHYIGTNYYQLTIRSEENIAGLGGSYWNPDAQLVRNAIVSSEAKKLVIEREAASAPQFYTPLFVLMPGEVNFGNITITWIDVEAPATPATGVTLSKDAYTIGIDEEYTLVATVEPAIATNKNVTWTSNNETVATVVNGVVTGHAKGTATITATTEDGEFTASCVITVESVEPMVMLKHTENNGVVFDYSITRNANRTLTFVIKATHEKEGAVMQVWINNTMKANGIALENGVYTFTTEDKYEEGADISGLIRMEYAGGVAAAAFNYSIGYETTEVRNDLVSDNYKGMYIDGAVASADDIFGAELYEIEYKSVAGSSVASITLRQVSEVVPGKGYIALATASSLLCNITNGTVGNAASYNDEYDAIHVNKSSVLEDVPANAGCFLLINNKLYECGTGCKVRPGSIYIRMNKVADQAPANPAPGRRRVIGNAANTETATALDNIQENGSVVKFMENGQIYILRDSHVYNMQGQIVK